MGTNYYAIAPGNIEIHLGKQSAGWPFLFRAHDEWRDADCWHQWVDIASRLPLRDEYGDDVSLADLIKIAITSTIQHHTREHSDALRPEPFSILQFMRGDFC